MGTHYSGLPAELVGKPTCNKSACLLSCDIESAVSFILMGRVPPRVKDQWRYRCVVWREGGQSMQPCGLSRRRLAFRAVQGACGTLFLQFALGDLTSLRFAWVSSVRVIPFVDKQPSCHFSTLEICTKDSGRVARIPVQPWDFSLEAC